MYFQNFSKILLPFSQKTSRKNTDYVLVTDITKNVRFKQEVLDNITLYDFYIIQDGETMEMISEKFYGTPQYHWVLMLLNDIHDISKDMPLPAKSFEEYVDEKYDAQYITDTYGGNVRSLLVDIVDNQNVSRAISGTFVFRNRNSNTTISLPVKSAFDYDPELDRYVVKFVRTDTGEMINPVDRFIDFSLIPLYKPIYLYDLESIANENKREIKIISQELMNLVLKNFKELIKS